LYVRIGFENPIYGTHIVATLGIDLVNQKKICQVVGGVRAETFCSLVIEYGYPANHILVEHTITKGSSLLRVDIIVYNDAEKTKPFIIIECKKEDASEAEFNQAVKQAFSYAHVQASTVKYIWVTKGNKNEYYHFDKESNKQEEEADIPHFGFDETPPFKFVKGGESVHFFIV
jgi:type I restriction enzyme M protein